MRLTSRHVSIVLVAIHSVWVIIVALMVASLPARPGYEEREVIWILVAVPDLPAFVVLLAIGALIDAMIGDSTGSLRGSTFNAVVLPAAVFLAVGGLQWWLVPKVLLWFARNFRWRKQRPGDPNQPPSAPDT